MATKSSILEESLKNRDHVIASVKEEMIGPMRIKENFMEFKIQGHTVFEKKEELYQPYYWRVGNEKEEILQRQTPSQRYVSGQLFPITFDGEEGSEPEILEVLPSILETEETERTVPVDADGDTDLLPQGDDRKTSTMGLTFCLDETVPSLNVTVRGGIYTPHKVRLKLEEHSKTWWMRESIEGCITIKVSDLLSEKNFATNLDFKNSKNEKISHLSIQLQARIRKIQGFHIITISITNRSSDLSFPKNQLTLFQSELEIETGEGYEFSTYPKPYQLKRKLSLKEASTELLYRNQGTFAFGHNCAATWAQHSAVQSIRSTFLPEFETQSMTPDIHLEDGCPLQIKMSDLAGLSSQNNPKEILQPLLEGYKKWIDKKESEIEQLPIALQPAAEKHISLCRSSLTRMKHGLLLLDKEKTMRAFRLANLAILLQQENGTTKRSGIIHEKGGKVEISFDQKYKEIIKTEENIRGSKNTWRGFQIAFFLMSISSFVEETDDSREIVDLIFFPTGGGKTEAYLGVAAFQMLLRRLNDPSDAGVDVIMRYTLRLLTADQFQRSSRLICALEYLRKNNETELGSVPYSIGIWVGGKTTPNKNSEANIQLLHLTKNKRDAKNFVISNCPWCGAKLGHYSSENGQRKNNKIHLGYKNEKNSLKIYCPDIQCTFHDELPIYIVDETIYKKRPTFLIGTVDKFVQLVWQPEARKLFGIDTEGERFASPPTLIIQDELHLISGPLGSLSGLFEILIEELCTKERGKQRIKPKIIAATATISQFEEQILALFGREEDKARLFPSPGLDHDDSYFAKPARDEKDGELMPGRKYVGVYTNSIKIMMSQVITFSAIIQSAAEIERKERDPFWTLLAFYNSLRDLGAALTLTQTDIPQYMTSMTQRKGTQNSVRNVGRVLELTSRKQSDEISKTIDDLKVKFDPNQNKQEALDLCLASNIIEVGIDIDRLSAMAIVGQPKMTAQYIQVSGRVGRRWWERPGVIFTLYSNTRSRDKSHFEHFQEYHQKLYAQVEPTSVTPFSDSCLDRGLKAIIVGFLRQALTSDVARSPDPAYIKKHLVPRIVPFYERIIQRTELIDPEQVESVKTHFKGLMESLKHGNYTTWQVEGDAAGFMYPAGSHIPQYTHPKPEAMINTMRNVDVECRGMISMLYEGEDKKEDAGSWEGLFI
ncbi:helicase-related protein [Domibacillus indicus]|uniref:helicase-related protein n=1 Tax=Domibacillus indicus TaxID=1437523 RepID=UPI000617B8B1|nr:helicase-related protein [Domibacillus indicus]